MTTQTTEHAEHAEQEALILDTVDKFLSRDVAPFAQKLEAADEYPQDIVAAMKALGLFGAVIPEEYGGLDLATNASRPQHPSGSRP